MTEGSAMTTKTAGVYLLSLEDAEAIQRLASDADVAATTRIPHPYPENGARDLISGQLKERAEGTGYIFTIKDRQELVGLCGLHGIEGASARELGFWIGRPFWGKGYASFGVKMVLQFAFQNLRLERVGSSALESNAASRRVLEKSGFRLLRLERHNDPALKRPDELLAIYEVTRTQWQDFINAPALAGLHPALKEIFVRLRQPFRTSSSSIPESVQYTEVNDPHWWKAEFSTRSPRHILAC
jgi:[ribosomal protein S5]-alanine N-acetyltransferase